jgi:hypothetical protein
MFDDAQNELFEWKLTQNAENKPITYANTIAKAKEIYGKKELEFRKTMKQTAVDYFTSMNSMLPNQTNPINIRLYEK